MGIQVNPMTKLNQEEHEILDVYESGKMKRVSHAEELIERHQEYAEATLRKDAQINIRISSKD